MSERIVIVDDDTAILDTLADFLSGEGLSPITFHDATTALRSILELPPRLVITDLYMPASISGMEFITHLREVFGMDLPIFAMSASLNREAIDATLIQEYIAKPFDLKDLLETIYRWVRSDATVGAHSTGAHATARMGRKRYARLGV